MPDDALAHLPLKPLNLAILVTLGERPHHGYGLMRRLRDDARWGVAVHTGPLYRALKQLLEHGLVTESPDPPPGIDDDARRGAYYGLSELGRRVLAAELARLASVVSLGRRLGLGEGDPT